MLKAIHALEDRKVAAEKIQAFNGKSRAESLNPHWFMGLENTAEKLEAWRRDYNEDRPHSAIGNKVRAALMKLPDASSPSV